MSDEVTVTKESVGVLAVLAGWGATIFFNGRRVGRVEESFATMQRDVSQLQQKLEQLQHEHEEDIASIEKWFRTESGGQKFMTFPDHDLICNRNGKAITQAIGQMTDAVKVLTAQVATLGEQFHALKVSVAVLQASSPAVAHGGRPALHGQE